MSKTDTTHGCASREEYEEYLRSVDALIGAPKKPKCNECGDIGAYKNLWTGKQQLCTCELITLGANKS
jgi:hypothetical protein